jgi:streptomycin 6-kinase
VRSQFYLPATVSRLAVETRGSSGRAWLRRLPRLVDELAEDWSLTVDPPFPHLSYNYVVPVTKSDGTALVLKVCFPDEDFRTEAMALRYFGGRGCARLVQADMKRGALLIERLRPGLGLGSVTDDRRATSIAARVMRQLWQPLPPVHHYPTVSDWVKGMAKHSPTLVESNPSFPARWIRHALVLYNELAANSDELVILHGDMHHENILSAEREDWLAIDPKGLIGERACEAGPLLINALPEPRSVEGVQPVVARRVAQLAEELELDRRRVVAWGIVRAVLAAYWCLNSFGRGWDWAIICAEALLKSE